MIMIQYKNSNTTVSGAWARDKWVSCVVVGLFLTFTIVKLKGPNKSLTINVTQHKWLYMGVNVFPVRKQLGLPMYAYVGNLVLFKI